MPFDTAMLQTLVFVGIVFGNQATTYNNRARGRLRASRPSGRWYRDESHTGEDSDGHTGVADSKYKRPFSVQRWRTARRIWRRIGQCSQRMEGPSSMSLRVRFRIALHAHFNE